MFKQVAVTTIFLITFVSVAFSAQSSEAKVKPVVVTTTTIIAEMVGMLAGGHVQAEVLIPPGACPGHFDLKPTDAMRLSGAKILIRHVFQGYLDRKLAAQNPGMKIVALKSKGQLLVPGNFSDALGDLKAILLKEYPEYSADLERNYLVSLEKVDSLSVIAKEKLGRAGISGVLVHSSSQQAEFARWAGLNVAMEFPNELGGLTMQKLKELITSAEKDDVTFIVGNYQGGGREISDAIARQTGLSACAISNFPGAESSAQGYPQLLLDSIDKLTATANRARHHVSGY